MAGPPPSPQLAQPTLQERVIRLVQTLQFAWFAGHVSMLVCTLRYALYYLTVKTAAPWARISYRTAFLSAIVTYGIVVYKTFRARVRQGKPNGTLAVVTDENVQYLIMAVIWIFSRQIPLALLPFVVYSVFHVATYTRSNVLPTINPPVTPTTPKVKAGKPSGAMADSIGKFIREYYDASMTLVAVLEIGLWFRLLGSALLFQRGSWILLLAYTAFFRARYAQSSFVQGAILQLGARGDALFSQQSTDPIVRNIWETVKGGLRRTIDLTDLTKYAQRGAAAGSGAQKKAE